MRLWLLSPLLAAASLGQGFVGLPHPLPPWQSCNVPAVIAPGESIPISITPLAPGGAPLPSVPPLTYMWLADAGTVTVGGANTSAGNYTANSAAAQGATYTADGLEAGQTVNVYCHLMDQYGQYNAVTKTITVVATPAVVESGATMIRQLLLTAVMAPTLALPAPAQSGLSGSFSVPGPALIGSTGSGTTLPGVACAAPKSVTQGQPVSLTAAGMNLGTGTATYSFTSAAGGPSVITAAGSQATLSTATLPLGPVTVTCTAAVAGGQSASTAVRIYIDSPTGEQALTAFQFTDSVGINMALHDSTTPYWTNFPLVLSSTVALGVKHARSGMDQYVTQQELSEFLQLAQNGIHLDALAGFNPLVPPLLAAGAPGAVEAFEGPNEDPNLPSEIPAAAAMYAAIRAIPAYAGVDVIMPTFGNFGQTAIDEINAVGLGLNPYVTKASTHNYFNFYNPETKGYGAVFAGCPAAYGSLAFDLCFSGKPAPGKAIYSTETGYNSTQQPDAAISRLLPRTLMMDLQAGVPRTYAFTLFDVLNESGTGFGLVNINGVPKPQFYAVKNLMGLFQDTSFANPAKLPLTLGGNLANVFHLTFQRSDGTFMVAIWQGVPSSAFPAGNTGSIQTLLYPPAQTVTLTTANPTAPAIVYTLDDTGAITSAPGSTTASTTTVSVTDRMTVVALPRP